MSRKPIDLGAVLAPSLLNDASIKASKSERIIRIPRADLIPNIKNQKVYDVAELTALAMDISVRGIQQALVVSQRDDGTYDIISGHRRHAANNIAVEQYQYSDGDSVPCRVVDVPKDEVEKTEQMILDNLQRQKSDYERMREIVEFKNCTTIRKERGEDIANVRDTVMCRLGVSNSDITRFERISDFLHPSLLEQFHQGKLSTSVAHEIARLDDGLQQFIVDSWPATDVLTLPEMTALTAAYNQGGPDESTEDDVDSSAAAPRQLLPIPKSVAEGLDMLDTAYSQVWTMLQNNRTALNKRAEKVLLKRIIREMTSLNNLQRDLAVLRGEAPIDGVEE